MKFHEITTLKFQAPISSQAYLRLAPIFRLKELSHSCSSRFLFHVPSTTPALPHPALLSEGALALVALLALLVPHEELLD